MLTKCTMGSEIFGLSVSCVELESVFWFADDRLSASVRLDRIHSSGKITIDCFILNFEKPASETLIDLIPEIWPALIVKDKFESRTPGVKSLLALVEREVGNVTVTSRDENEITFHMHLGYVDFTVKTLFSTYHILTDYLYYADTTMSWTDEHVLTCEFDDARISKATAYTTLVGGELQIRSSSDDEFVRCRDIAPLYKDMNLRALWIQDHRSFLHEMAKKDEPSIYGRLLGKFSYIETNDGKFRSILYPGKIPPKNQLMGYIKELILDFPDAVQRYLTESLAQLFRDLVVGHTGENFDDFVINKMIDFCHLLNDLNDTVTKIDKFSNLA